MEIVDEYSHCGSIHIVDEDSNCGNINIIDKYTAIVAASTLVDECSNCVYFDTASELHQLWHHHRHIDTVSEYSYDGIITT
eukprot:2187715-Amphidinium_carterae.1